MVKYNYLHIVAHIFKVVFEPSPAVVCRIARHIIGTFLERSDNIVNFTHIKGVPNRAVNAFKQLFAVGVLNIIVIAYNIFHGTAHCVGVHILNVLL